MVKYPFFSGISRLVAIESRSAWFRKTILSKCRNRSFISNTSEFTVTEFACRNHWSIVLIIDQWSECIFGLCCAFFTFWKVFYRTSSYPTWLHEGGMVFPMRDRGSDLPTYVRRLQSSNFCLRGGGRRRIIGVTLAVCPCWRFDLPMGKRRVCLACVNGRSYGSRTRASCTVIVGLLDGGVAVFRGRYCLSTLHTISAGFFGGPRLTEVNGCELFKWGRLPYN